MWGLTGSSPYFPKVFRVHTLPDYQEAPLGMSTNKVQRAEPGAPQACQILVIDDELPVLGLLTETLEHEWVDLVITDLVMPGANGIGVLRTAKEIDPQYPVMVITGCPYVDTAAGLELEVVSAEWHGHACSLPRAEIDHFEAFGLKDDNAPIGVFKAMSLGLRRRARPGDMIGGVEDTELGMILPETGMPEGEVVGGKILSGAAWHYTLSVGVAHFPVHTGGRNNPMIATRKAIKLAKDRGGNRLVHVDDSLPGIRKLRALW